MPLPLILGAAAAVAGAAGVGSAIHGGVKMKKANDTMKQTQEAHTANVRRFEIRNERCTAAMDRLGKLELEILQSFQKFSDIFERIQNKPEFRAFKHGDVTIPTYIRKLPHHCKHIWSNSKELIWLHSKKKPPNTNRLKVILTASKMKRASISF